MSPAEPLAPPRTVRLVAAVTTALVAGLLLWVSPAWAHTRLESTEPAADESTDEPFDAVVLIFSEAVQEEFAEVQVTDPAGTRLDDGEPVMDGERVEQPLTPLEEVGEYTVEWRVVARDGHPLDGTFEFEYDGELPEATEPEAAEPDIPEDDVAAPGPLDDETAHDDTQESEEPAPADEPDDTTERSTDEDVDAVAATAGGDSGSSGAAGPLGLAALVIAFAGSAAVYAVRAVRGWAPVAAPQPHN